jgi:phosphoribosylglycinamide formyltransferase-1
VGSRTAQNPIDGQISFLHVMSAPSAGSEPLPGGSRPRDIVVLVSGSGTNLQALIDATATPGYGVRIAAVGADRGGIEGLARAQRAGIPTFVCRVEDFASRADWDAALTAAVADLRPWLVVSAGFMKLVGDSFLREFGGRFVNTHPALLPSFPGAHGVRDALAHGVKVTGATLHIVDGGVDTGPIIGQTVVAVRDDDTVDSLHERIKAAEHALLIDCVGRMAREGFTVTNRKVTIP